VLARPDCIVMRVKSSLAESYIVCIAYVIACLLVINMITYLMHLDFFIFHGLGTFHDVRDDADHRHFSLQKANIFSFVDLERQNN
jgi:hypothetical protein